jgi:alkylation response protein AidB-like acyl-CoA dehydrogenase
VITTFDDNLPPFEELATTFVRKELRKDVAARDRYPFGPFFSDVLEKAHAAGFLGITLSEECGGIGADIGVLCTVLDRLCQADASLGGILFTTAMAQSILAEVQAATALKKIYETANTARDAVIAFPVYCNPGRLVTLPVADNHGEQATLSGKLEFLALGNIARQAVIPARQADGEGYSFFLVELASHGVAIGDPIFTLGLHACPSVDVTFDQAAAVLLGTAGGGAACFARVAQSMQLAAAAMAAGILKGSLEEALAYARERDQGGRKIIDWSEVRMILANMSIKARVADLSLTQACAVISQGVADAVEYSQAAALHIFELTCDAVTDGVQLLGGNGYMKEYGQEKRYRDARQVQALLGQSPLKKIDLARRLAASSG